MFSIRYSGIGPDMTNLTLNKLYDFMLAGRDKLFMSLNVDDLLINLFHMTKNLFSSVQHSDMT